MADVLIAALRGFVLLAAPVMAFVVFRKLAVPFWQRSTSDGWTVPEFRRWHVAASLAAASLAVAAGVAFVVREHQTRPRAGNSLHELDGPLIGLAVTAFLVFSVAPSLWGMRGERMQARQTMVLLNALLAGGIAFGFASLLV